MIRIPEETLIVSSTEEERKELGRKYNFHPSFLADELPAKQVTVRKFFIDEFPVTNAEYAAFMEETGHPAPEGWERYTFAERAFHPVVGVSAEDARAYADWAGKRLPTPEEWEAAFAGITADAGTCTAHENWMPNTTASQDCSSPVSRHGVRGFGQVCEWTDFRTLPSPKATFYMLKGPSWLNEEPWSFRVQSAVLAFHRFRTVFTGFRCAADTDIEMTQAVSPSSLPAKGQVAPEPAREKSSSSVCLSGGGKGRRIDILFGRPKARIRLTCPEGLTLDDKRVINWFDSPEVKWFSGADGVTENAHYTVSSKGAHIEVMMRTGRDYCELDYNLRHDLDKTHRLSACICVNLGQNFNFFDYEGARSFCWFGAGEWMPLRKLPRHCQEARWIAGPLPSELPDNTSAILAAVVSRDGKSVFGYGRAELGESVHVSNNFCFTCFHIEPVVPVPPGGSVPLKARLYCMEGGLKELRDRFASDFAL